MGKLSDLIVSIDIFGHPVGVNYKGEESFRTRLGAFCTVAFYVLTILSLTTLITAFTDNSKLETNTEKSYFDPFTEPAYSFDEYQSNIIITITQKIPADIGKVSLYQNQGCLNSYLG